MIGNVFACSLAAFAFARLDFRGRNFWFALMLGTLMLPSTTGGANWQGGSFDPETKIAYIFSSTDYDRRSLINDPKRSNMNYIDAANAKDAPPSDVFGLPLVKPGLVVLAVIVFTDQFMSFIWPLVATTSDDR